MFLKSLCAPLDLIDNIGGWSSIRTMDLKYPHGYQMKKVKRNEKTISYVFRPAHRLVEQFD